MSAAIRRLGSHDALSFKAIRLEALKANPELLRSTFELEDKLDVAWFAGRLQNPNVMGAFCDGELVGTAGFSIQEGAPNAYKGRLFGMSVRRAPTRAALRAETRSWGGIHLWMRRFRQQWIANHCQCIRSGFS